MFSRDVYKKMTKTKHYSFARETLGVFRGSKNEELLICERNSEELSVGVHKEVILTETIDLRGKTLRSFQWVFIRTKNKRKTTDLHEEQLGALTTQKIYQKKKGSFAKFVSDL